MCIQIHAATFFSHVFIPALRFIGEESTAAGIKCELTDDPTWIIDPVDGTMNFVHGYPNVCVSIALWVNKVPEIGIIYNPVLEQLYTARRGQGAFMNGKEIHVSVEEGINQFKMIFINALKLFLRRTCFGHEICSR